MRAERAGRSVRRVLTLALIGVGIALAVGTVAVAPVQAPDVRADFTWDSIDRNGSLTTVDSTAQISGGLQTFDFTWD